MILSFILCKLYLLHFCFQVEDPLAEATKYFKLLQNNSSDSLETHILSFELNMRKQKVLLAFQVWYYAPHFWGYPSLLFFPSLLLEIKFTPFRI